MTECARTSNRQRVEDREKTELCGPCYSIYIPGGTLALKGAIDAGKGPHCEPGCIFCEIDGIYLFDHWMRQGIK